LGSDLFVSFGSDRVMEKEAGESVL